jgi:hypothetical protein
MRQKSPKSIKKKEKHFPVLFFGSFSISFTRQLSDMKPFLWFSGEWSLRVRLLVHVAAAVRQL